MSQTSTIRHIQGIFDKDKIRALEAENEKLRNERLWWATAAVIGGASLAFLIGQRILS